jgi:AcrR family transcriptional regulator
MATSNTKSLGRRERKKQRVREEILDAAFQLFSEQGYEATTIAEIAETVDLAPSTVFRYFPTKVEMVFSKLDAIADSARATFAVRRPGVTAIDAVVDWVDTDLPQVESAYTGSMYAIPKIVAGSLELQDAKRLRIARVEDLFAQVFAEDLGGADSVEARVLSAITLNGMRNVWASWHLKNADDPGLDLTEACHHTAAYLRTALPAAMSVIDVLPAVGA